MSTKVFISFVSVFILCHAVKWIPNIWEWAQTGDNPVSRDVFKKKELNCDHLFRFGVFIKVLITMLIQSLNKVTAEKFYWSHKIWCVAKVLNFQPFNQLWLNCCTPIDHLYYCLFRKLYTAAIQQRLPYWPLGPIKISSPLALLSTALTHSRGVNIQRSRTVCILIGKGLDLGIKFLTKLSCTNLTGCPDHQGSWSYNQHNSQELPGVNIQR